MRRTKRLRIERATAVAAVVVGASAVGAAMPAEAGVAEGQVRVSVQVVGEAAADAATTFEVEIYDTNGTVVRSDCDDDAEPAAQDNDVFAQFVTGCSLGLGSDYSIGLDPLPENYATSVFCGDPVFNERIDVESNSFTIASSGLTNCTVYIGANMAVLTKDVVLPDSGGPETPADPGDFTLEVYDGDGAPHDSGTVATSPECDWLIGLEDVPCFYTDLESGDYSFGEVPVQGYAGFVTGCDTTVGSDERFDDLDNETVTVDPDPFGNLFICEIRNTYSTGNIELTKTLVNDDGGTAEIGDFTLELYDNEGVLVDSGVCAADGSCIEGEYPVGTYTVGESGPGGYTKTISQTVLLPTEPLTEPGAEFELGPFEQVTVNVENDDTPTTTTMTSTTMAPTTTLATTTTAFDGGGVTLPPTGDDGSSTVALLALGFLLLGGAGLLLSRR